jgi:hypothetical protein
MDHPISRSLEENDSSLSVTALGVVLALLFSVYFIVRAAAPDLPLRVHHVLADLPAESAEPASAVSLLQ